MQKIFNWTVGSFFRSIGRIIAYIVVGALIAYLLSANDFRITDLFFDNVNASTWTGGFIGSAEYRTSPNTTGVSANLSSDGFWYETINLSSPLNKLFWYKIPTINLPSNANTLRVNLKIKVNSVDHISLNQTENQYTCNFQGTYHEYSFPTGNPDIEFELNSFKCNSHNTTGTGTIDTHKWGIVLYTTYNGNDNLYNACFPVANDGYIYSFACPISTTNIDGFRISLSSNIATEFDIGISPSIYYDSDNTQTIIQNQQNQTNAINNQTQQQQQQHNEIMDDNTTSAEDEAGDFLGNFTVEDTGGLNAIITAPLSTIQSLLNNTCTKLTLPLPFVDENIELPCLYPIYNEYFGAFFTIYQTIILGIISYRCIKSLFFDVKGFTNPEDDRIEVMDL